MADQFWSLLGRAVHAILEHGADEEHLSEERLFVEVDNWVISGAIDVQHLTDDTVGVSDYKVIGEYYLRNQKDEWEQQLNCYAWLVNKCKKKKVTRLEIWAIIRDWSRHQARRNDYPSTPIVRVPIKIWSVEEQEAFVRARVKAHQDAEFKHALGERLPPCTDEDRWYRGEKWQVWKPGNKRPSKTFEDKADALAYMKGTSGLKLHHVPGTYVRCEGNYCHVREYCDQWLQGASGDVAGAGGVGESDPEISG